MCGIIGYTGKKGALKLVINGLKRLEYRGYDSAGVAVLRQNSIAFSKKPGKLHVLTDELKRLPIEGNTGIGHVRWATHGVPNEANAHPHLDSEGKIAVVHNGIIENHLSLKRELIKEGRAFLSETDTEVIPNLIAKYYKGNLLEAVRRAVSRLKGSYAICCVHTSEPAKIVGARRDSPLIIGVGESENFFASDAPAILDRTKNVIFLENLEVAEISRDAVKIIGRKGKKVSRKSPA